MPPSSKTPRQIPVLLPEDVLVVVGHHVRAAAAAALRPARVEFCDEGELLARLQALVATATEPAAVLIDSQVADPIAVARSAFTAVPLTQILFLASQGEDGQLRRRLTLAPRIGLNWDVCDPTADDFASSVAEAAQLSRKRRQHRTTIDKVRSTLAAPPAEDPGQHRRLVLSDRYLGRLLDQAADAIVSTEPGGTVRSWNHGAQVLFGYAADDILGRPLSLLSHAKDESLTRRLRAVAAGNLIQPAEMYLKKNDGSGVLVEASFAPVRDEAGALTAVSVIARDISERKRDQAALQEEKERLRVTLASIGDGVVTTDAEGRVQYLNPVAEALTGWTAAQAAGQPLPEVFRIVNETTRAPVENPAIRALKDGAIVGLANHTILIARDGHERPIDDSAAPIKDEGGTILGSVLVFRDISDRKQAEEQARYQADLTQSITDNATTAIFMMDKHSRCTFMNPAAEIMTGFSFAEVRGGILHNFIHHKRPDGSPYPMPECPIDRALPESSEVRDHIDVFFRKNGNAFPVVCNARVIYEKGFAIGTVIEVRDVTEERRAADALLKAERRLRAVLDKVPQKLFTADAQGALDYANPSWPAFSGCQVEALLGTGWMDRVHSDDRASTRQSWAAAVAASQMLELEHRLQRADGAYRWHLTRAQPVLDTDGSVVMWVGANTDVHDIKSGEAAARARSEQLRHLADTASRIHAAQDVDSVLGVVAEEARMLISAREAVAVLRPGQAPSDHAVALPQGDKSREGREAWSRKMAVLEGGSRSVRLPGASGRASAGSLMAALFGRDGRTIGILELVDKKDGDFTADDEAIVVQLAQMAAVAVENARLYESLREADHRKNEFLALLAHELRNPLAPIRTGLEALQLAHTEDATKPIASAASILATMDGQVRQMVRLVDDLLDIGRITQGKLELRKRRVDLKEIIRSAVESVQPIIEQGRQRLRVVVPQEAFVLEGDPARLSQVLANLLNNASKYTPTEGNITLMIERSGNAAQLSVRDDGIGIPAAMLGKIFDMFVQIEGTLERSHGGLGIGLHLVRRIVEMHGGAVTASSFGLGKGSTFTVTLPLVDSNEDTSSIRPSQPNPTTMKQKIVIADDNRDAADMLTFLLDAMGHEVRTAYDGQSAVAMVEAERPQVVLLDIGMPKLNGYEAAQEIRAKPWGKGVLLVALTGWGQDDDRKRSSASGFDVHLVKPVEQGDLEKVLATAQAAQATAATKPE